LNSGGEDWYNTHDFVCFWSEEAMPNSRVRISSDVLVGYDTLNEQEREALEAAISPLMKRPEKQWPKFGAIKLALPKPLYMVRVDKSLRAFVQPLADGEPEVVDFVRQELLDRYFKGAG
jgi:hypothetical protein